MVVEVMREVAKEAGELHEEPEEFVEVREVDEEGLEQKEAPGLS